MSGAVRLVDFESGGWLAAGRHVTVNICQTVMNMHTYVAIGKEKG